MNDALQLTLSQAIQKMLVGVDTATQFLSSQLPDVFKQYLAWQEAYFITLCSIWAVCIALSFAAFIHGKNRWTRSEFHQCIAVFGFLLAIFFFVGFCVCLVNVIEVSVAPKVYLLENIKTLIGQQCKR